MTSPTSRSLAELRRLGYAADVVERWIPSARIRKDLFGIFDIVAITPEGLLGIQCTSGSNHASRATKMRESETLPKWLAAGARAEVWSWAKQGERGARKLWTLRVEAL